MSSPGGDVPQAGGVGHGRGRGAAPRRAGRRPVRAGSGAGEEHGPGAGPTSSPEVVIRPSNKRKTSCRVYLEDGRVIVAVPAHLSELQRQEVVDQVVPKFLAHVAERGPVGLMGRAEALSRQYLDGKAVARRIIWVNTEARERWASCSPATATVRISSQLKNVPDWVLDYVLVHELAHLIEDNHGPHFKKLVSRYPKADQALIWLNGYGHGLTKSRSK